MPRPIQATIRPDAIANNIRLLKSRCPQSHCMAVVKANAYGHGLLRVLKGLEAADSLALLELPSVEALRHAGWAKPIVLLEGCFDDQELHLALQWQCDWVVHHPAQLEALVGHEALLLSSTHKPRIHLKVNTGMNRLGLPLSTVGAATRALAGLAKRCGLPNPVLMTHYANADAPNRERAPVTVQQQFERLQNMLPTGWQTSLGNSAAIVNTSQYAGEMVRPGIALYGATPGPLAAQAYGLQPAMLLNSAVIAVQAIKKGQWVGYGSRWLAGRDSLIAIVACGYADGYPRHAPDGVPVWIDGHIMPLAGRVSMDMLTVDVTDHPNCKPGSPVQLWGEHLPVDVVATASGTIGYELLCALSQRVPVGLA